jgi:hypothetical protein
MALLAVGAGLIFGVGVAITVAGAEVLLLGIALERLRPHADSDEAA